MNHDAPASSPSTSAPPKRAKARKSPAKSLQAAAAAGDALRRTAPAGVSINEQLGGSRLTRVHSRWAPDQYFTLSEPTRCSVRDVLLELSRKTGGRWDDYSLYVEEHDAADHPPHRPHHRRASHSSASADDALSSAASHHDDDAHSFASLYLSHDDSDLSCSSDGGDGGGGAGGTGDGDDASELGAVASGDARHSPVQLLTRSLRGVRSTRGRIGDSDAFAVSEAKRGTLRLLDSNELLSDVRERWSAHSHTVNQFWLAHAAPAVLTFFSRLGDGERDAADGERERDAFWSFPIGELTSTRDVLRMVADREHVNPHRLCLSLEFVTQSAGSITKLLKQAATPPPPPSSAVVLPPSQLILEAARDAERLETRHKFVVNWRNEKFRKSGGSKIKALLGLDSTAKVKALLGLERDVTGDTPPLSAVKSLPSSPPLQLQSSPAGDAAASDSPRAKLRSMGASVSESDLTPTSRHRALVRTATIGHVESAPASPTQQTPAGRRRSLVRESPPASPTVPLSPQSPSRRHRTTSAEAEQPIVVSSVGKVDVEPLSIASPVQQRQRVRRRKPRGGKGKSTAATAAAAAAAAAAGEPKLTSDEEAELKRIRVYSLRNAKLRSVQARVRSAMNGGVRFTVATITVVGVRASDLVANDEEMAAVTRSDSGDARPTPRVAPLRIRFAQIVNDARRSSEPAWSIRTSLADDCSDESSTESTSEASPTTLSPSGSLRAGMLPARRKSSSASDDEVASVRVDLPSIAEHSDAAAIDDSFLIRHASDRAAALTLSASSVPSSLKDGEYWRRAWTSNKSAFNTGYGDSSFSPILLQIELVPNEHAASIVWSLCSAFCIPQWSQWALFDGARQIDDAAVITPPAALSLRRVGDNGDGDGDGVSAVSEVNALSESSNDAASRSLLLAAAAGGGQSAPSVLGTIDEGAAAPAASAFTHDGLTRSLGSFSSTLAEYPLERRRVTIAHVPMMSSMTPRPLLSVGSSEHSFQQMRLLLSERELQLAELHKECQRLEAALKRSLIEQDRQTTALKALAKVAKRAGPKIGGEMNIVLNRMLRRQDSAGDIDLSDSSSQLSSSSGGASSAGLGSATHFVIDEKELELHDVLGEGAMATVYYGRYRGQDVAVKVLRSIGDDEAKREFWKECQIMSSLRSNETVYFYGATAEPNVALVLEYCSRGSLVDVMHRPRVQWPWAFVLRVLAQVTSGLCALHGWKPAIVHRDLKASNLMVDDNWRVKIGDFGIARVGDTCDERVRGTVAYVPPEIFRGAPATAAGDVYAVGIISWEIYSRAIAGIYSEPYSDRTLAHNYQILLLAAMQDARPAMPPTVPALLRRITKQCWHRHPAERPTALALGRRWQKAISIEARERGAWAHVLFDRGRGPAVNGER
jgi:tRNA A-37 threonylcarbamoyl transferase component Bud32